MNGLGGEAADWEPEACQPQTDENGAPGPDSLGMRGAGLDWGRGLPEAEPPFQIEGGEELACNAQPRARARPLSEHWCFK